MVSRLSRAISTLKERGFFFSRGFCVFIIALVVFLAHGLVLLNDGVYWDGWLGYDAHIFHGTSLQWFLQPALEMGRPLEAVVYYSLSYLPDVVAGYHLLAFIGLFLQAVMIFLIAEEAELTSRAENLAIAVLASVFPAFQVSFELSILTNVLNYAAFLGALYLGLRSEKAASRRQHIVLRISALLIFFYCFSINSLLAFYLGAVILLGLYILRSRGYSIWRAAIYYLTRRPDFLALPFVYWILKENLFPRFGRYADYNQFVFSISKFIDNISSFFENGIYQQFALAINRLSIFLNPSGYLVVWLFFLLMIAGILRSFKKLDNLHPFSGSSNAWFCLFYGIGLLCLAVLPYAAVGLYPDLAGTNTRHSLLLGLPAAIILVELTRLAFTSLDGRFSFFGSLTLTILILLFSSSMIYNYLDWQARWARDRSVFLNLQKQPYAARNYSIYWVDDQVLYGGDSYYMFYEWSTVFKLVWGEQTRIGLVQGLIDESWLEQYANRYVSERYNLQNWAKRGCQATLTVKSTKIPAYDPPDLAVRYLYYRFIHPDRLNTWLEKQIQMDIQPKTSAYATACRTTLRMLERKDR